MKKPLIVPKFNSEVEESAFWDKVDLGDYYEASDVKRASFPNLKPSSASISIRFPEWVISRVKEKANSVDVPYQSLIKQYVVRGLGITL